jgi:hypothetical protein
MHAYKAHDFLLLCNMLAYIPYQVMHARKFVIFLTELVSRTDSSLNHQHKKQVLLVYTSLKILSVLTAVSKHFTVQLIEAHSVITLITSNVLNSSIYPDAYMLATALTHIGQLARHSNDSELLSSTFQHDVLQCNTLGSDLCILLQHAEGAVRSKCCSLIGNLCKAGDWWLLSVSTHWLYCSSMIHTAVFLSILCSL